jgi:hypothetical protein
MRRKGGRQELLLVAIPAERTQEVDELQVAILLDQHIVRLQISMSPAVQDLKPMSDQWHLLDDQRPQGMEVLAATALPKLRASGSALQIAGRMTPLKHAYDLAQRVRVLKEVEDQQLIRLLSMRWQRRS